MASDVEEEFEPTDDVIASRKKVLKELKDEDVELPVEGSVGLITYMRTDSTRVSDRAIAAQTN